MKATEMSAAELEELANDWPYKFRIVPVAKCFVDERYQRAEDERRVARMNANYNPFLFAPLVVNDRRGDGRQLAVFDGQHRLAVARLRELEDVPALVFFELSAADESRLFNLLQSERKPLSPYDEFRSELFRKEPEAVAINAAVLASGYEILLVRDGGTHGAARIAAIISLRYVQRGAGLRAPDRPGPDSLRETLHVLNAAWGRSSIPNVRVASVDGDLIRGLGRVAATFPPGELDTVRMVGKLSMTTPEAVREEALPKGNRGGGGSTLILARYLADLYNMGLRGKRRLDVRRLGRRDP